MHTHQNRHLQEKDEDEKFLFALLIGCLPKLFPALSRTSSAGSSSAGTRIFPALDAPGHRPEMLDPALKKDFPDFELENSKHTLWRVFIIKI